MTKDAFIEILRSFADVVIETVDLNTDSDGYRDEEEVDKALQKVILDAAKIFKADGE